MISVLLFMAVFPILDNDRLNNIIYHKDTHSYDLPRAYQYRGGFHSAYYNISAVNGEPFGNANREFPWDRPGGLIHPIKTIKLIHLPGPVVWYKERGIIRWMFPPGTISYESLKLNSDVSFQVRVREKTERGWIFYVFQPFNSLDELNQVTIHPIEEVLKVRTVKWTKFKDIVHVLPEIIETDYLLQNTVFKDVFGSIWTPNTLSNNSIFPKDNILFVVKGSCVVCHKSTSMSVSAFEEYNGKYGNIRGDDQIFSWYPFDPSCISYNGYSKKIVMSEGVEEYDPKVHKGYYQTGGFK